MKCGRQHGGADGCPVDTSQAAAFKSDTIECGLGKADHGEVAVDKLAIGKSRVLKLRLCKVAIFESTGLILGVSVGLLGVAVQKLLIVVVFCWLEWLRFVVHVGGGLYR